MLTEHPNLQDLWERLYRDVRHRGLSHADAEDHAQNAFLALLKRTNLAAWEARAHSPEHALNRLYLLSRRVLTDTYRKQRAEKRLPMWNQPDPLSNRPAPPSPDEALVLKERQQTALQCLRRLREEMIQRGQGHAYRLLSPHLHEDSQQASIVEIARELGLQPGSVRVLLYRMRQRLRTLESLALSHDLHHS